MGKGHFERNKCLTIPGKKRITLNIQSVTTYKTISNVIGYLKGAVFPDRYVIVGSHHSSLKGYGGQGWASSTAVITALLQALMAKVQRGWRPDRTLLFCSWGGTALGNIGSYEWAEDLRSVLQRNAVAYVSLHNPVTGNSTLHPVASPSLQQLAAESQSINCVEKSRCPGSNVSSVQIQGDSDYFINHLGVPATQFSYEDIKASENSSFLSEALFPAHATKTEELDPSFSLHETIARSRVPDFAITSVSSSKEQVLHRPAGLSCLYGGELCYDFILSQVIIQASSEQAEMWTGAVREMLNEVNQAEQLSVCEVRTKVGTFNINILISQSAVDTEFLDVEFDLVVNLPEMSGVPFVCSVTHENTVFNNATSFRLSPVDSAEEVTLQIKQKLGMYLDVLEDVILGLFPGWEDTWFMHLTGQVTLQIATDPVLPFNALDIALEVQNSLKGDEAGVPQLLAVASQLRDTAELFQSDEMRPANDPHERAPVRVRMLNDVLQGLEKSFLVHQPPPGLYRNILYRLDDRTSQFSVLLEALEHCKLHQSNETVQAALSKVLNSINSAQVYFKAGLDVFETTLAGKK
ncbi:hypothetical protein TURU_087748 [Turdus rufiventris]|nr:hypothetical protein TURU_087748 [Turdus rufiventris]